MLIKEINNIVVYKTTIYLIILMILEVLISFLNGIVSTKLKAKISFELNHDIILHVQRLPISYFKSIDSIYLSEKINLDSNVIVNFILDDCLNLVISILNFILIFYLLFIINKMIPIFIIIIVILYIIIYLLFKNRLHNTLYNLKESQNFFASQLKQQFLNIKAIKLNNWYNYFSKSLQDAYSVFFKNLIKYARLSNIYSSFDIGINRLFNIILILYGGSQVLSKKLTIGSLTIISNYFNGILGSLGLMLNFGKTYQSAVVSYKRIVEILNFPIEDNGIDIINNIEKIEVKNLCFCYDNNILIKNFNYTFNKGNIYMLCGKNGSGKSTLVSILSGIITSYQGDLLYNNKNQHNLNMDYVRERHICILDQDCTLVDDTIYTNLIMNSNKVDKQFLEMLLLQFNIKQYISNLPDGFETKISNQGSTVSGGEKQKISLSRSLLKNGDFIILDEPTSAMDQNTIYNLKQLLLELKRDKIIIIVTHDSKLLGVEDCIINFDKIGEGECVGDC